MAELCAPAPITAANAITPITFLMAYLLNKRLAVRCPSHYLFINRKRSGGKTLDNRAGRSNDFTGSRPRANQLEPTRITMNQQPLVSRRTTAAGTELLTTFSITE